MIRMIYRLVLYMHAICQLQSMLLIPFSSTYYTFYNYTFSWSLSIFQIQKYYFHLLLNILTLNFRIKESASSVYNVTFLYLLHKQRLKEGDGNTLSVCLCNCDWFIFFLENMGSSYFTRRLIN